MHGKKQCCQTSTNFAADQSLAQAVDEVSAGDMQQDAGQKPEPGRESAERVNNQHPKRKQRTVKKRMVPRHLTPQVRSQDLRKVLPRLHLWIVDDLRKVVADEAAKQRARVNSQCQTAHNQRNAGLVQS